MRLCQTFLWLQASLWENSPHAFPCRSDQRQGSVAIWGVTSTESRNENTIWNWDSWWGCSLGHSWRLETQSAVKSTHLAKCQEVDCLLWSPCEQAYWAGDFHCFICHHSLAPADLYFLGMWQNVPFSCPKDLHNAAWDVLSGSIICRKMYLFCVCVFSDA